jgi:3-oxoadipate enol-lactonase
VSLAAVDANKTEVTLVRAGDLDVAVRIEGPPDAPAVLLVHGVLASHRIWDGLVARLKAEWRVVRYDLRGHGGTTATLPPYTIAQLARDAVALLDGLGVLQAHVIGTSLGGMIGQVLGAEHGDRVLSLTLANTTSLQSMPKAWEDRAAVARDSGMVAVVDAAVQRWFTPTCLREQPSLMEAVRRDAIRTRVDGFVGCAMALRDLDQRALLPSIAKPTLIIAGDEDMATPLSDAQALLDAIPHARLLTLPAAHQAAAERPEAFAAAWTAFQRS